jgi:hypothetical protein
MDFGVEKTQAQGLATEMLAETAWRQMFESLDSFGASGLQGQVQGDWLAHTLAQEMTGQRPGSTEGSHGA